MPCHGTTLSEYLTENRRANAEPGLGLATLLENIQEACQSIASAISRGKLRSIIGTKLGEEQKPLRVIASEIIFNACEAGGQLYGLTSKEMNATHKIPLDHSRGRYLLVFTPLDDSSNLEANSTAGTIFSVLRAPQTELKLDHFLQPGAKQIAAGFALYGPASMLVISLGAGVHGFTLDREAGTFVLTHRNMRIPETAYELTINPTNERFHEPSVRSYLEECNQGGAGPRGVDFNVRPATSIVADVHRVLIRGGLCMYPLEPSGSRSLRLLHEANPMALLVEQAGGAASTGRERVLDVLPTALHQHVPLMLGSRREVERLTQLHKAYDRGEDLKFRTPLLNPRSLFRTT